MKSFINQLVHTVKVFILFVGFTILFYMGMVWMNQEYENYNRYDQPDGTSLKVSSNSMEYESSWMDRLKLFYLNGE
ncbi:MAG: YqzK family protein [Bacillus sp. (in: firmicutes)]